MHKKHLIIILSSLVLSTHAFSFDLVQAWEAAQDYNAEYAAAKNAQTAGQEQAVQGRANLLPQVTANGQYDSIQTRKPTNSSEEYKNHGWNVQLTQPVFNVPKYAAFRQGQINSEISNQQFSLAEQDLLLKVSRAYFDVLLTHDILEATRAAKATYANQLAQAKAAFEVGAATILDTYEAQASYDSATAKEIEIQAQLTLAASYLNQLTGLPTIEIQTIDGEKVNKLPEPKSLNSYIEEAFNNNNTLKTKQLALEFAKKTLLAQQGSRLPTATLNGLYQDNSNDTRISTLTGQTQTRNSSIGIQLSMPLFAGGSINSQVREAKAKELQARDELEATRRALTQEVHTNYLKVSSGRAQVLALEHLLQSTKSKLEATRLGRQIGIRNSIELIQAEQAYYEAISKLAEARYNYLHAHLALAQSSGKLNDGTELKQINSVIAKPRK